MYCKFRVETLNFAKSTPPLLRHFFQHSVQLSAHRGNIPNPR